MARSGPGGPGREPLGAGTGRPDRDAARRDLQRRRGLRRLQEGFCLPADDGDRFHDQLLPAGNDCFKGYHRILRGGEHRKIRPDDVVEQVVLHGRDHVPDAIHRNGMAEIFDNDIVSQRGDPTDMIQVGMGDEDILQAPLLIFGQDRADHNCARIVDADRCHLRDRIERKDLI